MTHVAQIKMGQRFELYVQSTLKIYELPCCKAAVKLLAMIAAHESGGFRHIQQRKGPAKGILQMEPVGFQEVQRYMALRPEKFRSMPNLSLLNLEWLIFDTEMAIACARIFLMSKPEPLPSADNIDDLAQYAKKYWNTEAGKASYQDYADAYRRYCT